MGMGYCKARVMAEKSELLVSMLHHQLRDVAKRTAHPGTPHPSSAPLSLPSILLPPTHCHPLMIYYHPTPSNPPLPLLQTLPYHSSFYPPGRSHVDLRSIGITRLEPTKMIALLRTLSACYLATSQGGAGNDLAPGLVLSVQSTASALLHLHHRRYHRYPETRASSVMRPLRRAIQLHLLTAMLITLRGIAQVTTYQPPHALSTHTIDTPCCMYPL